MKRFVFGMILGFSILGAGCETLIVKPPPCASVAVPVPGKSHKAAWGQGVLVENRLLSAAHVFIQPDGTWPRDKVLLDGDWVTVSPIAHGDPSLITKLYRDTPTPLVTMLEDYVAFEVQGRSAGNTTSWTVRETPLRPKEVLHAVRMDVSGEEARYQTVPLSVLEAEAEEPIPTRLVVVGNPTETNLDTWSGCFVGSYNRDKRQWEFVGILISGTTTGSAHFVLRPSAPVLNWLLGRLDVGASGFCEPRTTSTPPSLPSAASVLAKLSRRDLASCFRI